MMTIDKRKMDSFSHHFLTIDVEDWHSSSLDLFDDSSHRHGGCPNSSVVTNTLKCIELLNRTKNGATFFVVATVAEHYPDLIEEIVRNGYEVASHSYLHKLVYLMTPQEFEDDLKKSVQLLGQAGAREIKGYRAPYWSITERSLWALEKLQAHGFVYDSSIFPISRKLYGIPFAPTEPYRVLPKLWEFPPATFPFFARNIPVAGGGYLRLMPYRFISWAMQRVKRSVFYFHSYELDPSDVPRRGQCRSFKDLVYFYQQSIGRNHNPEKIEKLLYEHRFVALQDAFSCFQNESTPLHAKVEALQ